MEATVLALVCLSPWAYGAVHPAFEFFLYAGVGLLLVLWGARMAVEGQVVLAKCPVALCLGALFLTAFWQCMSLPHFLVKGLSPGAARLYDRLLPEQPEALPEGEAGGPAATTSPGSTISLYPGATRREMARLLAAFLVFAVVRNNIASAASLRRLAIAALANGGLLSVFALVQYYNSRHDTVYWTYRSLGQVFGPFICRNHYPYYLNLCVGLGFGLLLATGRRHGTPGRAAAWRRGAGRRSVLRLLRDPKVLWISFALALMLVSVALCLSRGGLLALAGGFAVFALVLRSWRGWRLPLGAVAVAGALAVGLGVWCGAEPVQARLTTVVEGKALEESRLPIWSRVLPAVTQFPVCGTGYGTFAQVEPLYRTTAQEAGFVFDHAHNDYLEVLIEGGVPGLALSLLALGLVFHLGLRAVRLHLGRSAGALALGAVAGLATLAVHSVGDFGAHIPAIALLATVVCAQLCGLGSPGAEPATRPATPEGGASPGPGAVRLGGLAPFAGLAASAALGLLLCGEGWRARQVDLLQQAGFSAVAGSAPGGRERQIACLEAAARLTPEDAQLHADLGQAYVDLFQSQTAPFTPGGSRAHTAEALVALSAVGHAVQPAPAVAVAWHVTCPLRGDLAGAERERLARRHLVPGLRHFLDARASCPLLCLPHLELAALGGRLQKADPPGAYLERACLVAPAAPEVWYLCGLQQLADGRPDRAWPSWRCCLELSDNFLPQIVAASAGRLSAQEMVDNVLPDRPDVLVAAAQLAPPAGAGAGRLPMLERALTLLQASALTRTAEYLHAEAMAKWSRGQRAEAVTGYRRVLAREPRQVAWRFELAELLFEQGRSGESRHELLAILAQRPGHRQARALLADVQRELDN
jgi:O-antigen ligase